MIQFENVPHVTDFWGVVIPGWIAAFGGLASAVVGISALVISGKNRGGLEAIKNVKNREQQTPALAGNVEASGSGTATIVGHPPFVTWEIKPGRRGRYKLVNSSSQSANLDGLGVMDGNGDINELRSIPKTIPLQPGQSVPFQIDKSLLSPTLTAVQVSSNDGNGAITNTILYV